MNTSFKSKEGQQKVLELYDQKLAQLGITYDSIIIPTNFGKTHLLVTGSTQKPPLFLVHGSNACAPIALETYIDLLDHYRVYAVDVLAQPNKSEGNLLSMKQEDYGQWIHELLVRLDLEKVTMAGFSLGGLVILKALALSPSRIKAAYLSAPAYIVNGNSIQLLLKMFWPLRRYIKTQSEAYLDRFLQQLFSEPDLFARQYLAEVLQHFKLDFSPLPVISSKEAGRITTPLHLFAAEDDIVFPGKKMLKRAKKIFPSLETAELISGKHVQTKIGNTYISRKILG